MEAKRIVQQGGVCVELFRDFELTLEKAEEERKKIQLLGYEKAGSMRQENEILRKEYQDLGLNGQVQLLYKQAKAVEKEAQVKARVTPEKVGFKKITPVEMSIWKGYLPKEYKGDDVKNYSFDLIPKAVLTEWESARLFGLFTDFSVRTPEGKSILKRVKERLQDPILIGWFEQEPYLISRWGESLKSFKEIKLLVWMRRVFEAAAATLLIGFYFVIGICLIYFQKLNPNWINLLHCGYWLFFMPFLVNDIFLAIWRELHLFTQSKDFADTWKEALYCICLILSLFSGLLICVVNVL